MLVLVIGDKQFIRVFPLKYYNFYIAWVYTQILLQENFEIIHHLDYGWRRVQSPQSDEALKGIPLVITSW